MKQPLPCTTEATGLDINRKITGIVEPRAGRSLICTATPRQLQSTSTYKCEMKVIICPGIHDPKLTESFLEGLLSEFLASNLSTVSPSEDILIFPTQNYPAYSSFHIGQFLGNSIKENSRKSEKDRHFVKVPVSTVPIVFISFSAGVAGAIAAAWMWQLSGGRVKAFIAVDGWGVPLGGNFPIHRVSHDYFTHWSSAVMGSGEDSFYAAPPVEHLELWRSPQTTRGWWMRPPDKSQPLPVTAAQFLSMLLERYAV